MQLGLPSKLYKVEIQEVRKYVMNETIRLKSFITHPNFALAVFLAVCFFLPRYCGSAVTMVTIASIMSAYV